VLACIRVQVSCSYMCLFCFVSLMCDFVFFIFVRFVVDDDSQLPMRTL